MIKVTIADDHPMVLTGLQQMLEGSEIKLCGAYLSGAALLSALSEEVPDVLLLDLQLPDRSGEDIAKIVIDQYPSVKILVLSSIDLLYRVKQMLQLGCQGYSLKNVSRESLLKAIRTVNNNEEYIEPLLKEEMIQEMLHQKKTRPSSIPDVSRREQEVLDLLSKGNISRQIAGQLYISIRTVENHRKSLLHKFNVKNTVELLNAAKRLGVLK